MCVLLWRSVTMVYLQNYYIAAIRQPYYKNNAEIQIRDKYNVLDFVLFDFILWNIFGGPEEGAGCP